MIPWIPILSLAVLSGEEAGAFSLNPWRYHHGYKTKSYVLPLPHPATIRSQQRTMARPPLFMVTSAHVDSSDPFEVLGLDPNDKDSLDKKVIKRAYKRLALKYHPDVVLNRESTDKERKEASDRFAKINAAYETLIGKRDGGFNTGRGSSSTSAAGGGWTPPHRRKPGDRSYASSSSSSSSSSRGGVSWEDFMPKYDESDYDTGGDSFGAIFADLLSGAAGAASSYGGRGRGGLFQDFIEFLEQNVDGYGFSGSGSGSVGGKSIDADLEFLLQTGSVDDVANEMDDTDLVVQQLTTKLKDLENEIIAIKADMAASTRFSEKIELEEREAECNARKKVVEKYLSQARKRLLTLQTRYKQLITNGANDSKAGGRSRASRTWDTNPTSSSSTSSSASSSTTASNSGTSSYSSRQSTSTDPENSWKTEGFGGSGRSRGSSRKQARGASRSTQSTQADTATSRTTGSRYESAFASSSGYRSASSPSGTYGTNDSSSPIRTSSSASTSYDSNVPPHRRTKATTPKDDKERLRELRVDEEFDKLKKELGL